MTMRRGIVPIIRPTIFIYPTIVILVIGFSPSMIIIVMMMGFVAVLRIIMVITGVSAITTIGVVYVLTMAWMWIIGIMPILGIWSIRIGPGVIEDRTGVIGGGRRGAVVSIFSVSITVSVDFGG